MEFLILGILFKFGCICTFNFTSKNMNVMFLCQGKMLEIRLQSPSVISPKPSPHPQEGTHAVNPL